MKHLFAPSEAMMNRLGYPLKFAVLGAIVLVAYVSLMASLAGQLSATIARSESELAASRLSRPLSKVVELTQEHRGMSAALLAGDEDMAQRRAVKEREVEAAMEALEDALPPEDRAAEGWKAVRAEWGAIRREGLGWQPSASFQTHSRMIQALLDYQIDVADRHGLTFDPEQDTHYLMATAVVRLPRLLERMGQLRAKGSAALARGELDERSKIELTLLSEDIKSGLRDLERDIAKVVALRPELKESLRSSLAALEERMEQVHRVVGELVYLGAFRNTSSRQYFDVATEAIRIGYAEMYDILLPTLDILLTERIAQAEGSLRQSLAILIAVLAVISYLATGAYRSVMSSVRSLSEGSRRFADGDLTLQIELAARDELRLVADSFNDMAAGMHRLIASIQGNAGKVADSAQRMVASSARIDAASGHQSESASSMAAAVEEMTVGIDHIAGNAANANEVAQQSGELSRKGGEIVASVVEDIRQIAQSVSSAACTVEELGRRSEEISGIVAVIREIADQTNLLALNAAIEAARAGEQGRGFAVVADEVRKLAERTSQSTQEIARTVESMQQGTRGAVDSMQLGVARVNEGVERARQAGEAMAQIREGAARVVAMVAEISAALREQSAASTEIAKNVETIAQMAEGNTAAASAGHHVANELEALAQSLQRDVRRFRVA